MVRFTSIRVAVLGICNVAWVVSGCVYAQTDETELVEEAEMAVKEGREAKILGADEDYRRMPQGRRVHKSCIHELPSGSSIGADGTVHELGKGTTRTKPCVYAEKSAEPTADINNPAINGWLESVTSNVPTNYYGHNWGTSIEAKVVTPSKPAATGGLIYLFNGFQDAGSQVIIQPVLQYGNGPIAAGNNWVLASWYGGPLYGDNYYHSTPIAVSTGDNLHLYSTAWLFSCSTGGACSWSIVGKNLTTGKSTQLSVQPGLSMTWAIAAALEPYNVSTCPQLHGPSGLTSVSFNQIVLTQDSPYGDRTVTPFNGDCRMTSAPCWTAWVAPNQSPTCYARYANSTGTAAYLVY